MQYDITPADLGLVLALHRAGTLAAAGERLGVNASTVFRMLQRLERGLGQALFERGRRGYRALELARALAAQAEQVEAALEAARAAAQAQPGQAAGTVRLTTTDTLLHGLLAPTLAALHRAQPRLQFELHTGNELASLTRRDADIALRATRKPPEHLVGRRIGPIRVALYAARASAIRHWHQVEAGCRVGKCFCRQRTGSVQSVAELVAQGLGVGVLPLFLAEPRRALRRLTEPLDEAETDLWLLTHPEARHLQRVHTVWAHLAEALSLA